MKIIHCSDLHLDSKIDKLSSEKSRIRREEILRSFERMVEFAFEQDVRVIIIAGDMFDTTRITIKTKNRVLRTIINNAHIDFIYLPGNHDELSFLAGLQDIPDNLKVFNEEWKNYSYGEVVISGVQLTSKNSLTIFDRLSLSEKMVNIVVVHGQVVGYNSSEEGEIISIPKLKDKNIDYLALGHIHSYSTGIIDQRGEYVYCGCLDGRGFDETGEKGFVLLDVSSGSVAKQFVEFSSRKLFEIEFDVSLYKDYLSAKEELIKAISNYSSKDLLKIVLKGEHKTDFEIDKEGLEILLNERFFFATVLDKTTLKVELKDYETDKSVRGEFVRSVWESDLDSNLKQEVIMCGLKALRGEEI